MGPPRCRQDYNGERGIQHSKEGRRGGGVVLAEVVRFESHSCKTEKIGDDAIDVIDLKDAWHASTVSSMSLTGDLQNTVSSTNTVSGTRVSLKRYHEV